MISRDKTIRYSAKRPNGELMISHKHWKWFQPNNHKTGDCVIRAFCKYWDVDWLTAFDMLVPVARKRQENLGLLLQYADGDISEVGLKWYSLPAVKGKKRQTVESFAKNHPTGRYILRVASHVVAVVDGFYWDIWESGDCAIYGYWTGD